MTGEADGNESRLDLPTGRSLPCQPESVQGIGAGRETSRAGPAEQYRESAQFYDHRGNDHFAGEKEGIADALSSAAGRQAEDGIRSTAGADQNDRQMPGGGISGEGSGREYERDQSGNQSKPRNDPHSGEI